MSKLIHPLLALCRRSCLALGALLLSGAAVQAQPTIYGLGTLTQALTAGNVFGLPATPAGAQGIVQINPNTGAAAAPIIVTGVTAGQVLVGSDYRPNTGIMYVLGYNPALSTGNAQIYTMVPTTGVATPVTGTPITLALGTSVTRIGFDFNPVADRIRIVATNGINYRVNPDTGAIVTDGALAYAATDTNAGLTPGVGTAAYTNSVVGTTSTTLYDIDEVNGALLLTQNPPNSGTLNTIMAIDNPASFVNFALALGLDIDIYYDQATSTNQAYLMEVAYPNQTGIYAGYSSSNIYSINLANGQTTNKVNVVPANFLTPFNVYDIAVAITPPPCNAPTALTAGSITSTSATVSFTGSTSALNGYTLTTMPVTTTQTLAVGATSASLTGLTPNTAYTVTLVSNCAGGVTSSPVTVNFTTATVANPLIAVSQSGTGIANGGTFSGFPSTQQGSTSAPVTFTISNSSATNALTLGTFTFSGPYALSGTAPTSVAAGSSATFSVTFTPTAVGANTGSVSIANNSQTNNPYVVNFSGQGTSQDLVVSNAQNVSGSYRNVTVTSTGVATLVGPLMVSGTFDVSGNLNTNCQPITGAGNFILNASGLINICDANGITLSGPTGSIQLTGSRSYSPDAIYSYNGTVAQVTGNGLPTQIGFLRLGNAAGLNLSQALRVSSLITLFNGNLNTTGQPLTLLSSATGTALVDNTGGTVNGTATVQRYIDPSRNGGPGYRHYSSPVAATTVSDLTATGYTPVVNPSYNTVGSSVTPFPTVFSYNETRVTTSGSAGSIDFDKGFFSPSTLSDVLTPTLGYTVNVPATANVDFVGSLNNGSITVSGLAYGAQTQSGWHLRGNPYPSPLDWNLMISNGRLTNVNNALYVFKSSGQYTGSYASYIAGVGTNGGSNVLPLAQGFFVRTSAPGQSGSIAFTNQERLTTPNATPFQRGTRTLLTLGLSNAAVATQAAIYFNQGATTGFDAAFDALSLPAPNGLTLATEAGAEAVAINGQPLLTGSDVLLPLRLSAETAGTYSLRVDELSNLPAGYHAYLRDALTGSFTDLATTPAISLNLAANGPAGGRYAILFTTQNRVLATASAALARLASVYPNPAHGAATLLLPVALRGTQATLVSVVDNLGRTVLTRTLAAGAAETLELPLSGLAPGVYSVQARTALGLVAKRLVVQ